MRTTEYNVIKILKLFVYFSVTSQKQFSVWNTLDFFLEVEVALLHSQKLTYPSSSKTVQELLVPIYFCTEFFQFALMCKLFLTFIDPCDKASKLCWALDVGAAPRCYWWPCVLKKKQPGFSV